MTSPSSGAAARDRLQRSSPPAAAMWLPGALQLFVGLWIATSASDDLSGFGWFLAALGLACLVIGAVAQGVAWGMDIHRERHP